MQDGNNFLYCIFFVITNYIHNPFQTYKDIPVKYLAIPIRHGMVHDDSGVSKIRVITLLYNNQ